MLCYIFVGGVRCVIFLLGVAVFFLFFSVGLKSMSVWHDYESMFELVLRL